MPKYVMNFMAGFIITFIYETRLQFRRQCFVKGLYIQQAVFNCIMSNNLENLGSRINLKYDPDIMFYKLFLSPFFVVKLMVLGECDMYYKNFREV